MYSYMIVIMYKSVFLLLTNLLNQFFVLILLFIIKKYCLFAIFICIRSFSLWNQQIQYNFEQNNVWSFRYIYIKPASGYNILIIGIWLKNSINHRYLLWNLNYFTDIDILLCYIYLISSFHYIYLDLYNTFNV